MSTFPQIRGRLTRAFRTLSLAAAFLVALTFCVSATGDNDEASPDNAVIVPADVEVARIVLHQWFEAFQSGDYKRQWSLTDPRIRRWWPAKRWQNGMLEAAQTHSSLKNFKIIAEGPLSAEKIPCTEMGHCYRRRVPYVVFILQSEYENTPPPQPEYVAMALSTEGWRFGGGNFPNRPLGETAVIRTEVDESRYLPKVSSKR